MVQAKILKTGIDFSQPEPYKTLIISEALKENTEIGIPISLKFLLLFYMSYISNLYRFDTQTK